MRENAQSNLQQRCLQDVETFLVIKKGLSPPSLIIPIPTPHPNPGFWESGSNCRAFKDLPRGMLSGPGMRGSRPSAARVMLTRAVGFSGVAATRGFCYHWELALCLPWTPSPGRGTKTQNYIPQKWQENCPSRQHRSGENQPGGHLGPSISPSANGLWPWEVTSFSEVSSFTCKMRIITPSFIHPLKLRACLCQAPRNERGRGACFCGGVYSQQRETDFNQTEVQTCSDKLRWTLWRGGLGVTGVCYKAPHLVWEARRGFAEEGKLQAKTLTLSRRWEREGGREECGSRENSRCEGPQGRKH